MAPLAQLRTTTTTTTRSALLVWLAASALLFAAPTAARARGQAQAMAHGSWSQAYGQAYNQATPSWGPRQAPQAPQAPQVSPYQQQGAQQAPPPPTDSRSCTTPRRQAGHCILLQHCKVLLDLLRSGKNSTHSQPNQQVTKELRLSFCGFEGNNAKVCCADSGTTLGPSVPDDSAAEEPAVVKPLSLPPRRPAPSRPSGRPRPQAAGGDGGFMLPVSTPSTDAPYEFPTATESRPVGGGGGGYPGSPAASAFAPPLASGAMPSSEMRPEYQPQPQPMPQPESFSNGEDLALSLSEPESSSRPDYPVENLALLPTEVCGLSMHREQRTDNQVTNRTGVMRYPWMARLGYKKDGERLEYLCTGSLISERYVLTAAHCLQVLNGPVAVRLGEWDTNVEPDCIDKVCAPSTQDVEVEEKITHEDFRDGLNDIALLRLNKPVAFSESVRPICLPVAVQNGPEEDPVGKSMLVASWGNTSPNRRQNAPSRWLLHFHMYVDAPRACGAGYDLVDDVRFDNDKHLCVAGGGCHGDSGSPLMLSKQAESDDYEDMAALERDVLHGVLSYGVPDCAVRGAPLVFTRVARYVPWVLRNLRPNPFVPKDELVSGTGNLNPRIITGPNHKKG